MLDTVVMSNAVHVYVSQAHKGELVMGAGIDPYNSYAQRGSFHVIEEQMAAALELFPIFARARVLRTWAGIVDVCPDAGPIVGPTPVENLFVNCGWGTGGFKAHAGIGLGVRLDAGPRGGPRTEPAVRARAVRDRSADRRARCRGGGALMLLIPCPWCGPRDEIEFRYGGEAHVAYPADPPVVDDLELARYIFYRGNPKGRFQERWVHQQGCRRWFNLVRDTVTHEIAGSYLPGQEPPA